MTNLFKPSNTSINPENLVKIDLIDSEISWLEAAAQKIGTIVCLNFIKY